MLGGAAKKVAERPFREFVAPWPMLAVGLMIFNDLVLKPRWPGMVSGKLSDVSICFFLPLYLSAALSLFSIGLRTRMRIGCTFVALVFVSIKTSTPASDIYCSTLRAIGKLIDVGGFVNTVDPTDLIALPCVALAYGYALRSW